MSTLKLSIIIPVYNVEKYIEKCIISLIDQNIPHSDYEILVINDGTKDNSVAIVKELQKDFANIRLIEKENGGLSSSRNKGIEYAKGEYIWFVDSDDYIDNNVLSQLLEKVFNENLDIVIFGHKEIEEATHVTNLFPAPITEKTITNIDYLRSYNINISACFHIAKRNIYIDHDLRFYEDIYHEDYEFMLRFYQFCKRIGFIDLCPYNYILKQEGTITSSKNYSNYLKRLNSWITICQSLNALFPPIGRDALYGYFAYQWTNMFKYHACSALLMFPISLSDKLKYFKLYKQEHCLPSGKPLHLNFRRRMIYFCYSVPSLYKSILVLYTKKQKVTSR